MSFDCRQPPPIPPPENEPPLNTSSVDPIDVPLTLLGGESRDSHEKSDPVCAVASQAAWVDYLTNPVVNPEFAPSAGLVNVGIQAGPNVIALVGSLSTSYLLDFSTAVPAYLWNLVEEIIFTMPWSSADDVGPWRLVVHFADTETVLIPGVEEVSVPVPLYHPGTALVEILPSETQPALACPPDVLKVDDVDGIDSAKIILANVLSDLTNDSDTPDTVPFNVNMTAADGSFNLTSPPILVQSGP